MERGHDKKNIKLTGHLGVEVVNIFPFGLIFHRITNHHCHKLQKQSKGQKRRIKSQLVAMSTALQTKKAN